MYSEVATESATDNPAEAQRPNRNSEHGCWLRHWLEGQHNRIPAAIQNEGVSVGQSEPGRVDGDCPGSDLTGALDELPEFLAVAAPLRKRFPPLPVGIERIV